MQLSRKARSILFIFPMIFLLNIHFALINVSAKPGDLDTNFAGDGNVHYYGVNSGPTNIFRGVYVNGDDDVFATGVSSNNTGSINYMMLMKHDEDGNLDTSFDSDGKVTLTNAAGGNYDSGFAVAEDTQGRVIVVGDTKNEGHYYKYLAVWRFTSAGALDTTFSGDGIYDSSSVSASTSLDTHDVVTDSSDKIYVLTRYQGGMSIWKFNTNGTLDTSFDSDGIMVNKGLGTTGAYAYDMEMDSQDRLVVAGKSYNSSTSRWEPTVWRVDSSDGSMDTSFDSDGVVSLYYSGIPSDYEVLNGVAIGSGDKIAAIGTVYTMSGYSAVGTDAYIAVMDEYGALDTSFDSDGIAIQGYSTSDYVWTQGYTAKFDSMGRLVVNGLGRTATGPYVYNLQILRYLSNGSLDTDYSEDGKSFLPMSIGGGAYQYRSLAIDSKGRLVNVGSETFVASTSDASIWRFRAGKLDTVGVDVNPGLCENYVDVDSAGVLTVAIQGTSTFDVTDIVTSSIELEGVEPEQTFVQDMSDATDCDEPSDTYDDLIIRFRISDLPAGLQSFTTGQTTDLDLSADLVDNGSIEGTSTIEIINN